MSVSRSRPSRPSSRSSFGRPNRPWSRPNIPACSSFPLDASVRTNAMPSPPGRALSGPRLSNPPLPLPPPPNAAPPGTPETALCTTCARRQKDPSIRGTSGRLCAISGTGLSSCSHKLSGHRGKAAVPSDIRFDQEERRAPGRYFKSQFCQVISVKSTQITQERANAPRTNLLRRDLESQCAWMSATFATQRSRRWRIASFCWGHASCWR